MKNIELLEELDIGMSNFDHSIDDGLEEALIQKPGKVYARHCAWDFLGYVWFEDGKFHEQVWCHHSFVAELEDETLETLMEKVNSEYGSR